MKLTSQNNIAVEFIPDTIPDQYCGPLIKGARFLHHFSDSFRLFIQEFKNDLYTLRYSLFSFTGNTVFSCSTGKEGLHVRMLLKSALWHNIEQIGELMIGQNQFAMLWSADRHCNISFNHQQPYEIIDICYSPFMVEQLYPFFSELQKLKEGKSRLLSKKHSSLTPAMMNIINEMVYCPYDANTSRFYFDIKTRELLFVLLQYLYKRPSGRYRLSEAELKQVMKAGEMLTEDLTRKPYTIAELSARTGINQFKLKAGFSQLYGTGVFEYLQEKRMEHARQLLMHTHKPIKEICTLAGYTRMTNFITAFRKRFGYTPGSLRRT